MLVLKRLEGERIIINPGTPDQIAIKVCNILSGAVKLGITAPREVVVLREELRDRRPAGGR